MSEEAVTPDVVITPDIEVVEDVKPKRVKRVPQRNKIKSAKQKIFQTFAVMAGSRTGKLKKKHYAKLKGMLNRETNATLTVSEVEQLVNLAIEKGYAHE